MGYDVLYDNIGVLERPPQIGSTIDCPNPVCQPQFLANGGIPPENLTGITVLDRGYSSSQYLRISANNVKYPYSETWNLGIQHVFAKEYTADIRYVGTRGVDLNVQNRLNFVRSRAGSQDSDLHQCALSSYRRGLTTAWASADPGCNTVGEIQIAHQLLETIPVHFRPGTTTSEPALVASSIHVSSMQDSLAR